MASEADFPFEALDFEVDPYLEFKIEGDRLARRPDSRTSVPLDQDGRDPFYQAQMFQKSFESLTEVGQDGPIVAKAGIVVTDIRDVVTQHSLEALNNDERWRGVFGQRLAVSAFMISIIERSSSPRFYDNTVLVAGKFQQFDHSSFRGRDTLIALFTDPRFIDPDAINASDIDHIAVPVLGIDKWNYSGV